jgi:hypothetical protein
MKFLIFAILVYYSFCEDDLSIDILPSEKYKLNKRDINHLKNDIERQVKLIVK